MRKKPQYATLKSRKVIGKMTLEYMSGMLGLNTCNIVSVRRDEQFNNIEKSGYLQQFRIIQSLADVGIFSHSLSVFNSKKGIF